MTQEQAHEAAEQHSDKIVREIRRTLHGLVIATIVLFIVIGAIGIISFTLADDNRRAVCNLSDDLERRVATSEKFAEEHPKKVEELGFTQAQIQKEIANQRRTLDALSAVSCD